MIRTTSPAGTQLARGTYRFALLAHVPRYSLRALCFHVLLFLSVLASSAGALTVNEILRSPERFDRKEVVLTGRAESVHRRVSHRGNEYTTFTLRDESGSINVFAWGKLAIRSGDQVQVRGTFQSVKRVGRYTFRNEIDVSSVRPAR